MATLHTVNGSPFRNMTLFSCLKHVKSGDSVLLIEDGVYGALSGSAASEAMSEFGSNVSFYALGADVVSRGINSSKLLNSITLVDYAGFVDLAAKTERTQNWL